MNKLFPICQNFVKHLKFDVTINNNNTGPPFGVRLYGYYDSNQEPRRAQFNTAERANYRLGRANCNIGLPRF